MATSSIEGWSGLEVVVTGGTGALGTALCRGLVEAGARVHVPCFDAGELDRFELAGHDAVVVEHPVDLTHAESVEGFYAGRPPLWASLHIAGGFAMAPLEETSPEDFNRLLHLNLTTCFLCCRAAVASIRRRAGQPSGGRIVNVAARPALEPRLGAGMAAYTTSKAGVAALTAALAEELAPEGIWVNAIAPSIIDTPANRRAMPDADHDAWPKPADLARTLLFLAGPGNTSTRGAVVPVYGRS
jgi:NAD(P)-dependent dehydrogenase (short-subunit alcohol dehydrogenase family)